MRQQLYLVEQDIHKYMAEYEVSNVHVHGEVVLLIMNRRQILLRQSEGCYYDWWNGTKLGLQFLSESLPCPVR